MGLPGQEPSSTRRRRLLWKVALILGLVSPRWRFTGLRAASGTHMTTSGFGSRTVNVAVVARRDADPPVGHVTGVLLGEVLRARHLRT